MVIALGAGIFSAVSTANENELEFSIPVKPAKQENSGKIPSCFPTRNVGIAETAKDYYSSCKQAENLNAGSTDTQKQK